MGKYRGHQDKSRRGREKKLLKKKRAAVAGPGTGTTEIDATKGDGATTARGAGSPGRQAAGVKARGAGVAAGAKRKLKHVTYDKEHSVLIVGDGDFSFCRGVIRHRETGAGVVATSLDSQKAVLKKYPRAQTWLPKLNADGAQVVHSVDATRLEETLLGTDGGKGEEAAGSGDAAEAEGEKKKKKKKRVLFDRVVFNFPHTGKQRIHLNRNLIRDFFASTKGLVKCAASGGEIHVTLKDKPPYSGWNVKGMAKESGLVMVRCLAFDPSVFPGYRHSTTDPQAKEFDAAGARTSVFCRARSPMDDDVDESGAFPVIAQHGPALSSESDGQQTSPDSKSETKPGDNDDGGSSSDGEDSDGGGDLFGNGGKAAAGDGGLDGWDGIDGGAWEEKEEDGAKDGDASGGAQVSSSNGKKGRKKGKKKGGKDGPASSSAASEAVKAGSSGGKVKKGAEEGEKEERGMLRPPVEKKKAAKRRAQRKKKAAAAKEAAAAAAAGATAAGGGVPSMDGGGKAKSPKRKRGKYIVGSANKRPRGGE